MIFALVWFYLKLSKSSGSTDYSTGLLVILRLITPRHREVQPIREHPWMCYGDGDIPLAYIDKRVVRYAVLSIRAGLRLEGMTSVMIVAVLVLDSMRLLLRRRTRADWIPGE